MMRTAFAVLSLFELVAGQFLAPCAEPWHDPAQLALRRLDDFKTTTSVVARTVSATRLERPAFRSRVRMDPTPAPLELRSEGCAFAYGSLAPQASGYNNIRLVLSSGGAAGGVVSEGQGYGLLIAAATLNSLPARHPRYQETLHLAYELYLGWVSEAGAMGVVRIGTGLRRDCFAARPRRLCCSIVLLECAARGLRWSRMHV